MLVHLLCSMPGEPPLYEPDRADAEWFLAEMLVIFLLPSVDAFETAATEDASLADDRQLLYLAERGAEGHGREVPGGFVVLKGSRARMLETQSIHAYT